MPALERLYVSVIEETFICDIDSVEDCVDVPVMSVQEVLFHQLEFDVHVKLSFNKICQSKLNVVW